MDLLRYMTVVRFPVTLYFVRSLSCDEHIIEVFCEVALSKNKHLCCFLSYDFHITS